MARGPTADGSAAVVASGGSEQPPLAVDTLEGMAAPLLEAQPGADHEVLHGARDQDFAGPRLGHDASADVYGDSADVFSHADALARVQPGAHLQAERPRGLPNREAAPHGPSRAVEEREKPVAGRRDLLPAEVRDLAPNEGPMAEEEITPHLIAETGSLLGRPDDVGE